MDNSQKAHLQHGLKPRHVELIALSGCIGTGLFLGSGQTIHSAGPAIILAYAITGLACFFLMRALGELLTSNVKFNSYISLIGKLLGKRTEFVTGWTYWACWITIAMTEITASGMYMKFWFPHFPQWATGLIALGLLYLLNSLNVSKFGETEFWFSIIKVLAIVAIICIGLILSTIGFHTNVGIAQFSNVFKYGFFSHGLHGLLFSLPMVVFSFVGIEIIGMMAAETKNPAHEIPKCINNIPVRILLFYIGALLALMCIYPWTKIVTSSSPFVQVLASLGIKSAAGIINFVVLTAALSSCDSGIFSAGRLVMTLSGKHSKLAKLSKNNIPFNGISLSVGVIGIVVILNALFPNDIFSLIANVATVCFIFIWSIIILTHLKYRSEAKNNGKLMSSFKMPLSPYSDYFVLVFFIFVCIILIFKISTLVTLICAVTWISLLYIFTLKHNFGHNKLKE